MKNLYELVKLDLTLKDNRDDKRIRKRNEVYNLAKMKLDSWIKMTLISEDAEIEMKQAILDLVRGYGSVSYTHLDVYKRQGLKSRWKILCL